MNRCHSTLAPLVVIAVVASCASDNHQEQSAATTAAVTPPATPVSTTAPSDEWIAYQRGTGLRDEIYVVRPDGTDAHAIAHGLDGTNQSNPDWSPDGKQLVFPMGSDDGHDDLWTVDVATGTASLLLECTDDCVWFDDPAWSPDGSKVAYDRVSETAGVGVGTLEIVDVGTGSIDMLATGTNNDAYAGPRWSPDGQSIVAEVVHRSDPSVFADNVVGVTLSVFELGGPTPVIRPLTEPALFAGTADWSPDGTTIVYAALPTAGAENPDLFTIHPDGAGNTRLTHLADVGSWAVHPTFSTDGRDIVFVGPLTPGGDEEFLSVPTTGGAITLGTTEPVVEGYHPRIRPSNGA